MATISITCPNCEKVLKTKTRPPEGKKIKCPNCLAAFVPEDIEEEDAGIQEKPKSKSKSAGDEEDSPKKKKKGKDDEDLPSIKKKKKQKSSMTLYLILGGGFLAATGLCVCCGGLVSVGLWVWPGWLLNKSDLIPYVSTDANLLVGGDPKVLYKNLEPIAKKFFEGGGPGGDKTPTDLVDFMKNGDRILAFMNTNNVNMKNDKLVILMKCPSDSVEKLKKNPALGAAQTIGGHPNVYKTKDPGWPNYIAFPTDRISVMGDDEKEVTAALDRGKKPPTPGAAAELSKNVQSSHLWVAYTLTPKNRTDMREMMNGMKKDKMMGDKVKGVQDTIATLDGAKGVTFTMDITDAQDLKMVATLVCKNSDDATKASKGMEESWNQAKAFLGAFGKGPKGDDKAAKAVIDDLNSLKFQAQGSNATATLQFKAATVQEMKAKAGQKQLFFP